MKFEDLVGRTFRNVRAKDNVLIFEVSDDEVYQMFYEPDCCANCDVNDICGDLQDLVGSPIVRAEENGSDEPILPALSKHDDSFTWTFYRIGTVKGTVVIRWYGSSNGYYSETPTFVRVKTWRN